jgi:4-coumarate--CoA ligase
LRAYIDRERLADDLLTQELIKVKGNQIAPAELEALLLEHPAVSNVVMTGILLYVVRNSPQPGTAFAILPVLIA